MGAGGGLGLRFFFGSMRLSVRREVGRVRDSIVGFSWFFAAEREVGGSTKEVPKKTG